MKIEVTEVHWIEQHGDCSLRELAEAGRLSEEELQQLLELGVLHPLAIPAGLLGSEPRFAADCLVTMRSVRRLREGFELDAHGLSLALALLERVEEMERQLRALRAQMPDQPH